MLPLENGVLDLVENTDKESRDDRYKQVRAQYTQEFRLEAVRQVQGGQAQSVVASGRDEGVIKLLFDDSPEENSDGHGHGRGHSKDPGRRRGRHPRGRHDWRDCAVHQDGCRRGGHRQNHPPPPHAGREHRQGGRGGTWQLHGCAAGQEINFKRKMPLALDCKSQAAMKNERSNWQRFGLFCWVLYVLLIPFSVPKKVF